MRKKQKDWAKRTNNKILCTGTPKMFRKILSTILIIMFLLTPAYANNSPLDSPVQNLTSAGSDYVSGKITQDELVCKGIEFEHLVNINNKVIYDFFSSKDESEIKNMYEVAFNESDREYGKSKNDEEEIGSKVLDSILRYKGEAKKIIVYYNLREKPVVIYLTTVKDLYPQYFVLDMYPIQYENYKNNGEFRWDCLKKYTLESIENAAMIIASVKENGIDTSDAEGYLKSAKNNFESGNYGASRDDAYWALELAEKLKKLSEFRSLSDAEKIRFFQEHEPNISKEKINISRELKDKDKTLAELGSNMQFNLFLGNEANSLSSFTEIIDINNRTVTRYENQLLGDYDFYVGVDAALFYEMGLMGDAKSSLFSFGKRIGIGILKGEIKIKPFWKFYKILSIINNGEFSRGISSGIG